MKKHILFIITALIFCVSVSFTAFAAEGPSRLVDDADLLSISEEAELLSELDRISEKYKTDVVVVTVDSTDGMTPNTFANRFFDENNYGMGENRDGVLLLISMQKHDWQIVVNGLCSEAFSDSDIESIGELISSDLGDGEYADAFETYAEKCEYYIDGHINGFPFDVWTNLIIALVIGIIIAFIVTSVMRAELKSVRAQPSAANYVKSGSM